MPHGINEVRLRRGEIVREGLGSAWTRLYISRLVATLALAAVGHAENSVIVSGVAQVTKASVGLGSGGYDRQTSKAGVGFAAQYTHWWGSNGASLSYSSVRSDAGFANLACPATCTLNWKLTRREIAGGYVHRWRSGFYAGAGAGVFLTSAGCDCAYAGIPSPH